AFGIEIEDSAAQRAHGGKREDDIAQVAGMFEGFPRSRHGLIALSAAGVVNVIKDSGIEFGEAEAEFLGRLGEDSESRILLHLADGFEMLAVVGVVEGEIAAALE